MAHVVTVTRVSDGAIINRKVFTYPATAQAAADECADVAESSRLNGEPEYEVTCEPDPYSSEEDNSLDVPAQLRVRSSRERDDWIEANKIRG